MKRPPHSETSEDKLSPNGTRHEAYRGSALVSDSDDVHREAGGSGGAKLQSDTMSE
jgi:hypothetical protein